MLEREIESKESDSAGQEHVEGSAAKEDKVAQAAGDGGSSMQCLQDLLEQKGNDIELLQSMDSLVDIWRTIGKRALTVAINQENESFILTLKPTEIDGNYELESPQQQTFCQICKSGIESE